MGCKKLYLEHMDVLACTAAVTACTPRRDGGFDVETDRTPLFPEGGGQRSDVGTMDGARILHCREENGTVLHTVEKPFAPGSTVQIETDGAVRRLHTQQHTGEHLLSFAYRKLFGASPREDIQDLMVFWIREDCLEFGAAGIPGELIDGEDLRERRRSWIADVI